MGDNARRAIAVKCKRGERGLERVTPAVEIDHVTWSSSNRGERAAGLAPLAEAHVSGAAGGRKHKYGHACASFMLA